MQVSGPGADALERKIADGYGQFFTPTGKLKTGTSAPAIIALTSRRDDAIQRRAKLGQRLDDFDRASQRIEDLQGQAQIARHSESELDQQLKRTRSQAQKYQELVNHRKLHERDAKAAVEGYRGLKERIDAIQEARQELRTAQEQLRTLQDDAPAQTKLVEQCQQRAERARQDVAAVRVRRDQVTATRCTADQANRFSRALEVARDLDRQLAAIETAQTEVDRVHKHQEALVAPDTDTLAEIKKVTRKGEHAGGDFSNAFFGRPEDVHFREVNVGECRFAHCDLTKVTYSGATWDRQPAQFRSTRRSVRDERNVRSTGEYPVVARLYHQLRKNYEGQEQYEEAGDFHFGEMEMQRLGQAPPWSYVSLLAFYGWLSGYGQQSTVALAWLLFFVLLLFPGLYVLTGVASDVVNAVLHSLEVCTFLKSSGDVPLPVLGRFVDGFERILVGLQAGLFLVTVKRRFGRN